VTAGYDPTALATTPVYQVRALIGDTGNGSNDGGGKWLLQDEEIAFALTLRPGIFGAAATLLRSLANRFSRDADSVQGDLRILYSSRAKAFSAQATLMEAQAAVRGGAMPYAGGITTGDKRRQEQNPDRVQPQFNVGMDDNDLLPVSGASGRNEHLD
jgi:hypothetical protein